MSFFIFPFLKNKTGLSESALSEICLCVIKEYALNREKLIERLISEIGADSILSHIGRIPDEERFLIRPFKPENERSRFISQTSRTNLLTPTLSMKVKTFID